MIRILSEKIHDNRFLRLIHQMLKAGYLEDWRYHKTLSGAPQGGVVSHRSSQISTCTSWTFSSRRFSSRSTPEEHGADPIPNIKG